MQKLLNKAKHPLSSSPMSFPSQHTQLQQPTALDVLRYRTHHGTNLGSIFVLEKWLFPSMFEPTAAGDSELDAVTEYAPPIFSCFVTNGEG